MSDNNTDKLREKIARSKTFDKNVYFGQDNQHAISFTEALDEILALFHEHSTARVVGSLERIIARAQRGGSGVQHISTFNDRVSSGVQNDLKRYKSELESNTEEGGIMSKSSKCAVCEEPSTHEYEGIEVCDKVACEFKIQEGLDYMSEVGDR